MMTVPMATNRATSPTFGDSRPQESKSASGFTPLPPIRRTSTFDLLTKKKLGGDDEDSAPSPVGSSDNETAPAPPMKDGAIYQNGNGQAPSQRLGGQASAHPNQPQNFMQPPPQQQHPAFANGAIHIPNGFAPGRGAPQFNGIQQQMYMGRGGPVGPQHPGQVHGQPNAFPMQNNGQPFPSQMGMGGNPVQKFPPGGQWKLEESHLSEPLNVPHRNRPEASSQSQQQKQPGYDPYDKETEEAVPPKIARTRPRNNSNNIPPVSAERFRGLFAPNAPEQQPQNFSPQTGHPIFRTQTNESGRQSEQESRNGGLTKEMDVRVDEIPDPNAPGEEQPRRSSGFFGLNNRRNTGAEPGQQQDKPTFLSPSGPKTSTWEHDDKPSMKKRLSELRGMIKGVGNAKDGERDDQPTKPSTSYMSRPSMQGPVRAHTGLPGQGPNQSSPLSQPPIGIGRTNTNESGPAGFQHAHGEDEHRKPGGGFLGGLFNKQGPKPVDARQQPNQPSPPTGQRPMQPQPQPGMPPGMQQGMQQGMQPGQQFRPGQMGPQGQTYGPHPMYPPGHPFNAGQPGQQGPRRPMISGQQLNPQDNIQSPTSPQFLGMAQAVMMRRPSEITVSSQSQAGGSQLSPGQSSQQGPQTNVRPATGEDPNTRTPQKQFSRDEDFSVSGALPRNSPQLSHQASQEQLNVNGSPVVNRTTPNRKPVGSGFSRQDGASPIATKSSDSEPRPTSADDERLSGQLPSGQQSPTLGKLGHVRQTSLPSPGRSPMPLQPGQVTSPQATGGGQLSPRGPSSSHNQQVPGQPHGAPQGQPGVPQQGLVPGPQRDPRNPQAWNSMNTFSNPQRSGPPNQNQNPPPQPPRPVGGPAPTAEQHNALSKFFGKTVGQGQTSKEENQKSAASKFLNAFKRGSKQSEQAHEQQRPPPGHQTPPQLRPQQLSGPQLGMARPPISGPSPVPAGPLGPMSNLPQGSMQPGQGRGQMLPPQGPSGRGNPLPPPMMYGAGRGVPPHMQPGQSQKPNQILGLQQLPNQQRRASTQRIEPQYDQVPIPRGYEAVHGYGNAGTLAPSPYNVGRPSPPPAPQQFQPFTPQGGPQQPWDPRLTQQPAGPYGRPPFQMPPNQQVLAQSVQRHTDSESSTTPTPSEQGTFLDMTPTPPRQSHESVRTDRQPIQKMPSQVMHGQVPQQPQMQAQSNLQRVQTTEAQTPSSSNWGSAPDSGRSPGKQNPLGQGPTIHAKPSDPNISPPSDSGDVPRSQPQHIATAMNNSPRPPQIIPPEPTNNTAHHFSPTSPPLGHQPSVPILNQSPPIIQGPPEERPGSAAAGRLVSKMSVINNNSNNNNEPPRNASLSPEIIAHNRAASVSPEPPGSRPAPFHQVSNASLNINVDRANDISRGEVDEDIYDATPRMGNSVAQMQTQAQAQIQGQEQVQDTTYDNTKYAGSERGRPVVNGAAGIVGGAAAAAGAGAVVFAGPDDAVSTTATPPEPGSEESTPPQRQIVPMNMEPEEKILVDQPVELAAVNDDDGVPAMSATSYPGQEWNPYAAGEFGDWE